MYRVIRVVAVLLLVALSPSCVRFAGEQGEMQRLRQEGKCQCNSCSCSSCPNQCMRERGAK